MKLPITLGKKRSSSRPPAPERVEALFQQGFSEPEIVRTLRREGYTPGEADMALRTAVRAAALPGSPSPWQRPAAAGLATPSPGSRDFANAPLPPEPPAGPRDLFPERAARRPADLYAPRRPEPYQPATPRAVEDEPLPEGEYQSSLALPDLPPPPAEEEELPPVGRRTRQESRNDVEELVEGVIEEKWGALRKELEDMGDRVERMEQRLATLEAGASEARGIRRDDVEAIRQSMDAYKDSLAEVSSRIEGMERAVKDSLTPMMQSLRSLSDMLKTMKRGSGE